MGDRASSHASCHPEVQGERQSSHNPTQQSPSPKDWAEVRSLASGGVTLLNAHFTQHRFERHSHATYSIGVTHSGVQTFACRGTRHASLAGDVMLFNPDEPHDGSCGSDAGFGYSILYVDTALVRDLFNDLSDSRTQQANGSSLYFSDPVVHDPHGAHLLRLAAAAVAERQETLHAEELTGAALQTLLGRHGEGRAAQTNHSLDPGRRRMVMVREYLDAHFCDDVSIERLADQVGLSRAHLTRAFTNAYGIAPHAYLNMVRIRQAQAALLRGDTIADIALACGFSDQSHMTRRFKGQVGIAPGRWAAHMLRG